MLQKIQQAREELQRAKSSLQVDEEGGRAGGIEIEDYDDSDDVIVGYGTAPSHYYGGNSLSPCTSMHEDDEEEGGRLAQSTVEVELIQSTVLRGNAGTATGAGVNARQLEYSVDEPSSDDEA